MKRTNMKNLQKRIFSFLGLNKLRKREGTGDCRGIYWNPEIVNTLDTWGEGNTWHELKFLMAGLQGNVLDIACGTGKNIMDLSVFTDLSIFGCDISDFLIQKAIERGIPKDRLRVCNAVETGYHDNSFDYSYSIGSFEHFEGDSLNEAIAESYRITKKISFHTVPVSKKNINEGWIKNVQDYYNNSTNWWMERFYQSYKEVVVLDSLWKDRLSSGKWFVCIK